MYHRVKRKRFGSVVDCFGNLGRSQAPPPSPDNEIVRQVERLNHLVLSRDSSTIEWATSVRSAGLDLFVETERFLALAVEFSCWLLTSDHYMPQDQRFIYSRSRLVPGLRATATGGTSHPAWRPTAFPPVSVRSYPCRRDRTVNAGG